MTYAVAHLARATGYDPMTILEWPPDVLRAVQEVWAGTDPLTEEHEAEAQLAALHSMAGTEFGG